MRVWHKLISASLILMAMLAPSISLAVCAPTPEANSAMHCPPDCPMMAAMQHENEVSAPAGAQSAPPCCTIKSSNPVRERQTSIVAPATAIEAPLVAVPFYASVVLQAVDTTEPSPPPPVANQALLCTFLI